MCYLYTSPKNVMKHIVTRNKEAALKDDSTEISEYFSFMQYLRIYKSSSDNQGISIRKKEFENISLNLFKNENRLKRLQQYLIQSWFSEKNEIYILPKYPHDVFSANLSERQLENLFQLS